MSSKTIIVGNGWAALAALGLKRAAARSASAASEPGAGELVWVTGTGSRLLAPLPTLDASSESRATAVWMKLAEYAGIAETQAPVSGSYLREFRNKAFREPAWTKAPTPFERQEVRNELLWGPEHSLVPVFEAHPGRPMGDLEEQLRARLMADCEEGLIQRIDAVPVTGFRVEGGKVAAITLGSGEEIAGDEILFADRWANLAALGGLPKMIPFTRKRNLAGALQAVFSHRVPVGSGLSEGFLGTLHREAGEEFERHLLGYFSADGTRSAWTVCLTFEEGEDNHQIAKKLRRMKSALDKMFEGSSWVPAGDGARNSGTFMDNVSDEQVRFEENSIFSDGVPIAEPQKLAGLEGLTFLTDGYGPSAAFTQVGACFGIAGLQAVQAEPEASAVPGSEVPAQG